MKIIYGMLRVMDPLAKQIFGLLAHIDVARARHAIAPIAARPLTGPSPSGQVKIARPFGFRQALPRKLVKPILPLVANVHQAQAFSVAKNPFRATGMPSALRKREISSASVLPCSPLAQRAKPVG